MVSFPNCKINLGLCITGKRSDGFHNLETVFYPINFTDALEIITGHEPGGVKEHNSDPIKFSISGLVIDTKDEENICIKAYHLFKKSYPHLPLINMHLHKSIPLGAGLGGGSADGAFTLKLLNAKYGLEVPASQLVNYALQLGSDCPFFIINRPVLATGRGEMMKELDLNLSAYKLLIVNPGIHINTGWAFSQLSTVRKKNPVEKVIKQPIDTWKVELINDFEEPVMNHYSELREIKEKLYELGAIYAAMSGSGSTFYGIFEKPAKPDTNVFSKNYLVKEVDFL